jgi:alkylation response protein AidB-like acyl-CoA dehydrogenase
VDFSLNQEQRAWQEKARKFAAEEVAPLSLERDAILDPFDAFDWEVIKKGSKLGFRTAVVSKDEGGHGIDFVTQAVVMTELAKADSAISKTFSQCWKWSHLIAAVCNDDQKERFLKPFLADDTFVLGFGATEPNGGSDNRMPPPDDVKAGLRLAGRVEGDQMVLNGDKAFIANGSIAKLFFVYVRTDPTVPIGQGTTLMMIPRDTPGFRHGKVFNKSGWRFYQNAELIFENARVPMTNMVGELNGALRRREGEVGGDLFGDLELAANGLGICDAASDKAVAVVRARKNGGALKDQQLIQLKIGRMKMLTEALRSYVLRVAWEHDQHNLTTNAGLVMNLATDYIQEVAELGMDVFDHAGAPMDRAIDKLVRDTFIWSHLAGDSVQRMKVARRVLSQDQFNLI